MKMLQPKIMRLPLGIRIHYWRGWRGDAMPIKGMPFVSFFAYKLARRYTLRIGGLVMSCPMIKAPPAPAQAQEVRE